MLFILLHMILMWSDFFLNWSSDSLRPSWRSCFQLGASCMNSQRCSDRNIIMNVWTSFLQNVLMQVWPVNGVFSRDLIKQGPICEVWASGTGNQLNLNVASLQALPPHFIITPQPPPSNLFTIPNMSKKLILFGISPMPCPNQRYPHNNSLPQMMAWN